jgi:hypothetical protein
MRTAVPATSYIVSSPIIFISWWFLESPKIIFKILYFFFAATVHQLGYKSLFKTFFKPWKNEYRKGLVGFSVIMGIAIKSLLIFVESFLILFLLIVETAFFIFWVILPFIVLWGIYAGLFT